MAQSETERAQAESEKRREDLHANNARWLDHVQVTASPRLASLSPRAKPRLFTSSLAKRPSLDLFECEHFNKRWRLGGLRGEREPPHLKPTGPERDVPGWAPSAVELPLPGHCPPFWYYPATENTPECWFAPAWQEELQPGRPQPGSPRTPGSPQPRGERKSRLSRLNNNEDPYAVALIWDDGKCPGARVWVLGACACYRVLCSPLPHSRAGSVAARVAPPARGTCGIPR